MNHIGVSYTIKNDKEEITFKTAKEAAEYLNGKLEGLVTCCKNGKTYKGYRIIRNGGMYHRETHKTRLYKIWTGMRERCYREKHTYYKDYGGRGIKICKKWDDYLEFKKWALCHGYNDSLTIDRIDVNGNYEPSNCRWIPMEEQHKNRRDNRVLQYKGKKYILSDLAKEIGMGKTTLKERLNSGWSVEKAVETPVRKRTKG